MIETAGKLNFDDRPGGTQVTVLITFRPPAGYIGSAIGNFLNPTLKKIIEQDILKFKDYIESKAKTKEIS